MHQRTIASQTHPRVYKRLLALNQELEATADAVGLPRDVLELVKVRASQVNGCAFCTDLHAREALAAGVTQQQLIVLPTWREAGEVFTDAQQAGLALAEAMSRLSQTQQVPDEVYDAAAGVFSEEQLGALVWAGVVINAFNVLNVTTPKQVPID